MVQLLRLPKQGRSTGGTGNIMPKAGTRTLSLTMPQNSNEASSSQPLLQGSRQVFTVEDIKSVFHLSRKHSQQSPRPFNWLENTDQSTERIRNTSCQ
eukprot:10474808-Ditylum_brightwellii.AAC.1